MKAHNFYLLTLVLLAFMACKKQTQISSFEKKISGKWQYIGQLVGFQEQFYAADPAIKKILEFKKDKKFLKTENGQRVDQGFYELIQDNRYNINEGYAIKFNAKGALSAIFFTKDTLHVSQRMYDVADEFYIRIK